MTRTVHVVAIGARTPIGLSAESTAAAARAAVSRLAFHPFMIDGAGESIRAAIDGRLDPAVLGWRRMAMLCQAALEELLDKLDPQLRRTGTIPFLLSLPEARPGFSNEDVAPIVRVLRGMDRMEAWPLDVQLARRGHAGGLEALERAADRIGRGELELCLVGGCDSYLEARTIDWLRVNRQLATSEVRGGFSPGEGAGVLALASEGLRKHLRMRSLAVVRGIATATETKLIKTDAVNLGEGLSRALLGAFRDVPRGVAATDVYCDINGERYRSEEWGFAVLRRQDLLATLDYTAPADCWGDVGAASGPLLSVLAIRAWARRCAAGPRSLIWAGSEGGLRGAALMEAPPATS